jgi:hypothetical protein
MMKGAAVNSALPQSEEGKETTGQQPMGKVEK